MLLSLRQWTGNQRGAGIPTSRLTFPGSRGWDLVKLPQYPFQVDASCFFTGRTITPALTPHSIRNVLSRWLPAGIGIIPLGFPPASSGATSKCLPLILVRLRQWLHILCGKAVLSHTYIRGKWELATIVTTGQTLKRTFLLQTDLLLA